MTVSHLQRVRSRALRRMALTGFVVIIALGAALGIERLARAQPAPALPKVGAIQNTSLGSAQEARPLALTFNTLFSETFEGGPGFWQASSVPAGPRWNFVGSGSLFPKPPGGPAGPNAVWFGDPATGQYGGDCRLDNPCPIFSGTLTYIGTPISVPSNVSYTYLSFMSWELTEKSFPFGCTGEDKDTPYCHLDLRQVWISGTSVLSAHWEKMWSTDKDPIVENTWRAVGLVDVSGYGGQAIRLRFAFDTADPHYNPNSGNIPAGWYVDNIQLFTFTPTDRIYLPLIRKNSSG